MSIEFLTAAMFVTLGHPLAYTLAAVATMFGLIDNGFDVAGLFDMFANNAWGLMNNYVLVAIPLFILMAQLLDRSKVSDQLFEALYIVLGGIKGGLGLAVIVVCTVFAATTGIIGASVVAMGLLSTPALLKKGYRKDLTSGIICAAGTLGILIPPRIMMVVYGGLTGLKEPSVGNLFAGAIFPGLILASLYFLYILVLCQVKPEMGPPIGREEAARWSAKQKWMMTLKSLVPPLALILAVMGTILAGVATPTEAAGLGAGGHGASLDQRKTQLESVERVQSGHLENHRHGHDAFRGRQVFQHGVLVHGRRRCGGRSSDRERFEPLGRSFHHDVHRVRHGHVHRLGGDFARHGPDFIADRHGA